LTDNCRLDNCTQVRTIDWVDDTIVLIDQTLLPAKERVLTIHDVAELIDAIARLAVRGAMALGVAGAMGVALAGRRAEAEAADVQAAVDEAASMLTNARPTAVNLAWGVAQVLKARDEGVPGMIAAALAVRDQDIVANRNIGKAGGELLAGTKRVLTHCNAGALAGVETGTALAVIEQLHERGDLEHVYVCETRPLLQGSRLTAWELARAGVPHSVIVDGAAAGLILGDQVDAVVVGADRITANGDVVNKVGTLAHALAAARRGVPFVVAAPESTIDPALASGRQVPIELRDPEEVLSLNGRRIAPPGVTALNLAFDVTPADLVTAIVTEHRVIRPDGSAQLPAEAFA